MAARRPFCFLLALLLLDMSGGNAQETLRLPELSLQQTDTVSRRNSVGIWFDRNLSTFNWLGRLSVDTVVLGTGIRLDEQYSSNVIETDVPQGGLKKYASNQNVLRMILQRPVAPDVRALGQWSSMVYDDQKGSGLNNATMHAVMGGVEWFPIRTVAFSPLAGYRWDSQGGIRDQGFSVGLGAQTVGLDLDGYRINGGAQFHRDFLDPRVLGSDGIRMGAQKYFATNTRDSIEIGYVYTRREFYSLPDSTIESRLDRITYLGNLLEYEVSSNLLATLYVALSDRGLDKNQRGMHGQPPPPGVFDTRIGEFHLESYLQTAYRWEGGNGEAFLRLAHAERDEEHEAKPRGGGPPSQLPAFIEANRREQTKDNVTRRTTLSGAIRVPLSASDRMFVSGATSILRYDTPSTLNVEDRDELLVAASLGTLHTLSRTVELGLGLDASLNHTVYLLKERSANNNINRVLRLGPRMWYRPFATLASVNAFEVLANYTVYDYEQQVSQVRSYSYRQFAWLDSTTLQLSDRVACDFFAYVKLSERGQLNWEQFEERPENAFTDRTFAGQLRFTPFAGTVFAVGLRYFSQARYNYEQSVKTLVGSLRSIGPTCIIFWDAGRFGQLNLRGWYEHRTQLDGSTVNLVTMNLSVLFNF
jgi:hypothetical protein